MRKRSLLGMLVAVSLLGCSAACSTAPTAPAAPVVTTPPAPAPEAVVDDCPVLAPENHGPTVSRVAIDYVDFLVHGGRQYLASFARTPSVAVGDLGEVVLHSRCSFSAFNERTGRDPGRFSDGDTAFLPPGTAIRAVRGWAPECRLAAERDGQIRVYLALDPKAKFAQPAPCARG